jgi:hypothetical protein
VVVRRAGYSHPCGRKILISLDGNGRPTLRCPECRVLKYYWTYFHHSDPIPVILALQSLAARGLIGREMYRRLNPPKQKKESQ